MVETSQLETGTGQTVTAAVAVALSQRTRTAVAMELHQTDVAAVAAVAAVAEARHQRGWERRSSARELQRPGLARPWGRTAP